MKITMKRKWMQALRSGKYTQGKGRLKRTKKDGTHTYCCLGVLRDLYPKCQGGNDGTLSPNGLKEAGLTYEQNTKLACMNDGDKFFNKKRHTFKEIATWINKNV